MDGWIDLPTASTATSRCPKDSAALPPPPPPQPPPPDPKARAGLLFHRVFAAVSIVTELVDIEIGIISSDRPLHDPSFRR